MTKEVEILRNAFEEEKRIAELGIYVLSNTSFNSEGDELQRGAHARTKERMDDALKEADKVKR